MTHRLFDLWQFEYLSLAIFLNVQWKVQIKMSLVDPQLVWKVEWTKLTSWCLALCLPLLKICVLGTTICLLINWAQPVLSALDTAQVHIISCRVNTSSKATRISHCLYRPRPKEPIANTSEEPRKYIGKQEMKGLIQTTPKTSTLWSPQKSVIGNFEL